MNNRRQALERQERAAEKLNNKQRAFIDEYLMNETTQREAYMKIYKVNGDTASAGASRLLKKKHAQEYMNATQNLLQLEKIADNKDIQIELTRIMNDPEASNNDKIRAMNELNKMNGYHSSQNFSIETQDAGFSNLSTEELYTLLNKLEGDDEDDEGEE